MTRFDAIGIGVKLCPFEAVAVYCPVVLTGSGPLRQLSW